MSVDRLGRIAALGPSRDRDPGGSQDPITDAVASLELGHDHAFRKVAAGDADERLVLARVEGRPGGDLDRPHAFALEQDPQLAIDWGTAFPPAGALGAG